MALSSRDSYVDVLRLSDQDHQALVTEMDRGARGAAGREKRKSRRLAYHAVKGLILQVTHPGGTMARFMVKPRNLSENGLSVLHGGFVHPGTICEVPLRDLQDRPTIMRGRVIVCRHVRGRIHEVGIEFDRPIVIADYVFDAEPRSAATQPDVRPVALPPLSGRILVVDEWADDRDLLAYDLQKLGATTVEARSGADALRRVRRSRRAAFEIIVTGEWLGDMSAASLAESLRKGGCVTPILAVFSGGGQQASQAVLAGVAAVIDKPYTLEHLSSLLLQYLSLDEAPGDVGERDLSQRWSDVEMRPMILSFLQSLELRLADLEGQLARTGDQDPVQSCIQLKGAAAAYGFPRLSEAAEEIVDLLQQEASVDGLRASMTRLAGIAASALDAAQTHSASR